MDAAFRHGRLERTRDNRRDRRRCSKPHRVRRVAYRKVEAWMCEVGEIAYPELLKSGADPWACSAKIRKHHQAKRAQKIDPLWYDSAAEWLEPEGELGTHVRHVPVPNGTSETLAHEVKIESLPTLESKATGPTDVKRSVDQCASNTIFDVDPQDGPAANKQRMLAALPTLVGIGLNDLVEHLDFGLAAFGPMCSHPMPVEVAKEACVQTQIVQMVEESVEGVGSMRGQRGERQVTEMMSSWPVQGMWMHGPLESPVNSLIIPAIKHIFARMALLPPKHTKRVDCLATLALACQDCQQVQAREIMRIFSDLTAQNATLEDQLKYSLVREKEVALNCLISQKHPRCDLDYTQVQPWQQRVHLFSGYTSLIGDSFGLDSMTTARSDRFLTQALGEIGSVDAADLMVELRNHMSVKQWLQMLLADVNNQADTADRLIDRDCIFKWAQANMSQKQAYSIFYDADRATEFSQQDPAEPEDVNKFQPFLSCKVLADILLTVGMLTWSK